MTNTGTMTLPRPEDRCRGDLERWVGCRGAEPNWRSEGFAEDVVLPPTGSGAIKPSAEVLRRRFDWPLLWTNRSGLLQG